MNALFDGIIRGSIRNRYLVVLGALALVSTGLWSMRSARLDALPNFTPPIVVIQAEAPGLGSSAVERLVTTPLEQSLLGVPDVARVRSTSSPGLAVVQLTFEENVDVFLARQLASERIAEARDRLPPVLPPPRLAPITAPVGSLLKLSYTARDDSREGLRSLWQFAEWKVRPRLSAIEGIARVTVHGGAAARIEVRPDPAAMLARGVTLAELRQALEAAQSLAPLGYTEAGTQQQPVRAEGLWTWGQLGPIANTVVTTSDGLPVRVGDVAEVAEGEAPPVGNALYDGKPAIYLQVEKLPWADTLRLTTQVEAALGALDAQAPAGTERHAPTFRQADFIHLSMAALGRAMAIGAVLVVVVLVSFLRSARLAAVSLTALPLSIVAATTVLLLRGVTINGMILGGLAIAVGEVVDDAIVDVENIWRRLQENARSESPRGTFEVIHDASTEVRGAVVYASLIVVAVLTPLMILGGLTGRIFSPLAETYALAVAASLLVALTVTPALSALLLPTIASAESGDTRLTHALRGVYGRVLAGISQRPGRILAVASVLGAAALLILPFLGGGFLPEFREGVLIAEVTAWPGTSLEETTRLGRRIDGKLRSDAGLPHVAVRVGRASLDEDAAPVHRMEMDLVLPEASQDPEEVASEVMARMGEVPGVRFGVEGFLGERINELLSGERAPIALKLFGDELGALQETASALIPRIARIQGIEAVRSTNLMDVPTTDVRIDDARLDIAGIRRAEVMEAAAAWRQGLEVAEVNVPGGFSVPVVIAGPELLRGRSRIGDLPVFTAASAVLPLSALVRVEQGVEPPVIDHEGGRRVVTVTARAKGGALSEASSQIEQLLSRTPLPPGTSWELAGQAAERREARGRLTVIVGLVLTAVFALLWVAFHSAVDAAVVLGGLPLGMVGGVAAALLLPEGLSMAGLVGFVALSGIIARNGIMLVAHKNHLLASQPGADVEGVVLQAAQERLLPIFMTASTAFFGLLPLAASLGAAGSELEAPMALIVCGGLLSSTTLNLIAVPAFYLWRERRPSPGQHGVGRVALVVCAALCSSLLGCTGLTHQAPPGPRSIPEPWRPKDVLRESMPRGTTEEVLLDDTDGLSPDEAGILAIDQNPRLRAVRAEKGIGRAELITAGILPNPRLEGSLAFPTGGPDANVLGYGIDLSWNVTPLLSRSARVASARETVASIDLDVAWQEWQVAQAARLQTVRAIFLAQRVELARELEQTWERRFDGLRRARAEKAVTELEVTNAARSLSDARVARLDLEQQLVAARSELDRVLGIDGGRPIKLDTSFTAVSFAPAADVLVQDLPKRRLDLIALQHAYRSHDEALRAAVLERFPPVEVGFQTTREVDENRSTGLLLRFDIPLFDRNQGTVARQSAQRVQVRAEYEARLLEARSEVRRTVTGLDLVRQQLVAAGEAADAATRLAEQARAAAVSGALSPLVAADVFERSYASRLRRVEIQQSLAELQIALAVASGTNPPIRGK